MSKGVRKVYVLNASIVPNFGAYVYREATFEEARRILSQGFVSAVGYSATAELLSVLLGIRIPYQRIQVNMEKGDIALVFQLKQRLPEGTVIRDAAELARLPYNLGILERLG